MSSSLPGANTNVMKKKLIDNKATLGAAFPASESVSGWVTPAASAVQQKVRKAAEKYIFELLMNPISVFYTSALKYFKQ